jgi:hypothetical protein
MNVADLMRADPPDAKRAITMLVRVIELTWRSGAFACFYVLVTSNREVSSLDGKLALLTALGAFCFLPRLEIPAIAAAIFLTAQLVPDLFGSVTTWTSSEGVYRLSLAALGIWAVVCAAVMRSVVSTPERGLIDRDIALVWLGILGAGQVALYAAYAVAGEVAFVAGPAHTSAFRARGEASAFIVAWAWMVVVVMWVALPIFSGWRAKRSRTPSAMLAHPQTGAAVTAVGFMLVGDALPSVFGAHRGEYQWFGAAAGAFIGCIVWLGFYLGTTNQHLRTWGAVRFLLVGLFGLVTYWAPAMAVPIWLFFFRTSCTFRGWVSPSGKGWAEASE